MYKYKTEFNPKRQIDLVQERISWTGRSEKIYCSSEEIYDLCTRHLKMDMMTDECVVMFCTDSVLHVVGYFMVSQGTAEMSVANPRTIFQKALLAGASGIVIAHNHPSGITSPSDEDIILTERVVKAGALLGISVWDHIIIGDNQFYSFREQSPEILEVAS